MVPELEDREVFCVLYSWDAIVSFCEVIVAEYRVDIVKIEPLRVFNFYFSFLVSPRMESVAKNLYDGTKRCIRAK